MIIGEEIQPEFILQLLWAKLLDDEVKKGRGEVLSIGRWERRGECLQRHIEAREREMRGEDDSRQRRGLEGAVTGASG